MSDVTTWAVLTDGRYVRVLFNRGHGKSLLTLKADDSEALTKLCYELVMGIVPGSSEGVASKKKSNMQLVADFLTEQYEAKLFDRFVIAAPEKVIKALRDALPQQMTQLISGELAEDILPMTVTDIEEKLGDMIIQGRND